MGTNWRTCARRPLSLALSTSCLVNSTVTGYGIFSTGSMYLSIIPLALSKPYEQFLSAFAGNWLLLNVIPLLSSHLFRCSCDGSFASSLAAPTHERERERDRDAGYFLSAFIFGCYECTWNLTLTYPSSLLRQKFVANSSFFLRLVHSAVRSFSVLLQVGGVVQDLIWKSMVTSSIP